MGVGLLMTLRLILELFWTLENLGGLKIFERLPFLCGLFLLDVGVQSIMSASELLFENSLSLFSNVSCKVSEMLWRLFMPKKEGFILGWKEFYL